MAVRTLRYQSPKKIFGIKSDPKPFEGHIDQWKLFETFEIGAYTQLQKGIGTYHVVAEKPVASGCELSKGLSMSPRRRGRARTSFPFGGAAYWFKGTD